MSGAAPVLPYCARTTETELGLEATSDSVRGKRSCRPRLSHAQRLPAIVSLKRPDPGCRTLRASLVVRRLISQVLRPPEIPGATDVPPSDFTRLIRSKNPPDRKSISEPQRPELKREEPNASGPAYGPATRVFQSPRKNVGPASPDPAGGEFTRIYGPRDTAHQFAEDRPDINREGGGQGDAGRTADRSEIIRGQCFAEYRFSDC